MSITLASLGKLALNPHKVTLTSVTVPVKPRTAMDEGYGSALLNSSFMTCGGMVIGDGLEKTAAAAGADGSTNISAAASTADAAVTALFGAAGARRSRRFSTGTPLPVFLRSGTNFSTGRPAYSGGKKNRRMASGSGSGTSPDVPKARVGPSWTNQIPFDGRNTATSASPSPL